MFTLAISFTKVTGYRLAEVGELLGLIGGLALLLGGLGLAVGFLLLILATRWGHFH